MSTLLTAARSYYGLADALVLDSEMFTQGEHTTIVFKLGVTDEDLRGILARMKTMQEEAAKVSEKQPEYEVMDLTRATYDALDAATKGKFGSFSRYLAWGGVLPAYGTNEAGAPDTTSEGAGGRKIVHIDAPEEESGKPEAVWLRADEATEPQKMYAVDTDFPNSRYLVQVAMLTPEQRARYVQPGEQHG